jgi:hypothetical protein
MMMRIVGIALLVSLLPSALAQPAGAQSELRKRLGVPQPSLLFSTKHRLSFGEGGYKVVRSFVISQSRKYFYMRFGQGVRYENARYECYDRNGRLVSRFRVLDDEARYEKHTSDEYKIIKTTFIVDEAPFEHDTLCVLLIDIIDINSNHQSKKQDDEEYNNEEYVKRLYKFLVFSPDGKIDNQKTNKLNLIL